jgi:Uncharacterized conserved protein|nr:DUF502 domain-containing protein [uncultured Steroidobacter sp.]
MRVLKLVLVGGALFLLPLLLLWVLLAKAFHLALAFMQPIESALPGWTIVGVEMPHLAAVLVILVFCLLAGLWAQTKSGRRWYGNLERKTLGKIPGYVMLRTLLADAVPTDKPVEVALVEMENMRVIAFVMERHADGHVTVFVPSAPTPAMGSVFFAHEAQVQVVNVSLKEAMMCISRLGIGAEHLLTPRCAASCP